MPVKVAKTTFTLAEAAALLSCHAETLRRAIREGTLKAAKLGRGYRISRLDLENFWAAQGGGELFRESGEDMQPEARVLKPGKKKANVQQQLPLLPLE